HPNPTARHGYHDADYPDAGAWPGLYKYMTIIGAQIGISDSSQIFIMPYFTSGSITSGLGMFPENWRTIVTDIVRLIQKDITGNDEAPVSLKDLVITSYSYGVTAAAVFRKKAATTKKGSDHNPAIAQGGLGFRWVLFTYRTAQFYFLDQNSRIWC